MLALNAYFLLLLERELERRFVIKGLASLAIGHFCAQAPEIFDVVVDGCPALFEAGCQFFRCAGRFSADEAVNSFDVLYSFCEIHRRGFFSVSEWGQNRLNIFMGIGVKGIFWGPGGIFSFGFWDCRQGDYFAGSWGGGMVRPNCAVLNTCIICPPYFKELMLLFFIKWRKTCDNWGRSLLTAAWRPPPKPVNKHSL